MFRYLILLLSLLTGLSARAAVWADVTEWSPEYEAKFAEWVRTDWRADFSRAKICRMVRAILTTAFVLIALILCIR